MQQEDLVATREGRQLRDAAADGAAKLLKVDKSKVKNVWLAAYKAKKGYQIAHPDSGKNRVRVLMCWTQDGTPRKIKITNKRPGRKVSATVVDADGNSSVKTSTATR